MTIARVSVDHSTHNYSDKDLSVKAKTISDNLTEIPIFLTLAETAALIKAKKIVFDDFLSKMPGGNKQITVLKNNARLDLESVLKSGALKVQDISGGDEAIILSSGYDITRKGTPVGILDQVVNLQIKLGKLSGSLEISWDVVDHAYSYEIQYTKNPKTDDSVYKIVTSTKRKILLENLIPGQTYSVKVAAVGSDPKRVWSVEIISCYVS
jgi:hypothetical protein